MYVKLFSSLYQGTLRGRSDEILVFTNLLAHADQYGIVDKHWKAISEETGLTKEQVEAALLNLEAPDPESRSPENDGRRIVRTDEHRSWGWQIVNYRKYRAIRNEEDRREQNRLAQERWRNKHTNKQNKPPSSQAEADTEEGKSRGAAKRGSRLSIEALPVGWAEQCKAERPDLDPVLSFKAFRDYWIAIPGSKGVKLDWEATWRNWIRREAAPRKGNGSGVQVEVPTTCAKCGGSLKAGFVKRREGPTCNRCEGAR